MTVVRSRRAAASAQAARHRPIYARVLALQHIRPSDLLCFGFFEGAVFLAVLLALAELASWWIVPLLPLTVAAMVKLNDILTGMLQRASSDLMPRALGRASVPAALHPPQQPDAPVDEWVHSPEQRARQSGARRYE